MVQGGKESCAAEDSHDIIRPYVDHGLPRIVQAIQCMDYWPTIAPLLRLYAIDTKIIGPQLLLQAASAGNSPVIAGLDVKYNVRSDEANGVS